MPREAVDVILQSHLQAVLMDPEKLISLARYLQAGGKIEDLAKTLGLVMESLERLKNPQPGPPPGPSPQEEPGKSWTWTPGRIPWKNATGPSGPYERAEDPRNPEFESLLIDLNGHKGSLTRDGLYYWLFTDGQAVGRKKARGP
jgi:hypothetical protein